MKTLRTPDERFAGLPAYDFEPHYAEVAHGDGSDGTLRIHYLDEGSRDGEVILCLHGEPSWSFLYRHMVGPLVDAGLRVVAPDLVGFGRSDKPTERSDYTYARLVEWTRELVFDHLDLSGITLICQDWGGLIGLRLVGEHPDRFARVVAANTFLPEGRDPGKAFFSWQKFSQEVDVFPTGTIVQGGTATDLSDDVVAAYDAPFPDESYKAGARMLPMLVPSSTDDPAVPANLAAWAELERFDKPFLCAFSDKDPITAGADSHLLRRIPGTKDQSHTTITDGGHFLQEDQGPQLAKAVIDFVRANPAAG